MKLAFKDDFEGTKIAWRHFWAREAWKRPLVVCDVPREGEPIPPGYADRRYFNAINGNWEEQMSRVDAWFSRREFLAESVPFFAPDFGPDQFAAYLSGSELQFDAATLYTNWHAPVIDDLETFEIKLHRESRIWKDSLDYARFLSKAANGRFLVGVCDLHSNLDALSALRGAETLCMDLLDQPEMVDRVLKQIRELYVPVYEALREASGINAETGGIGWIPFWSDGRFAVVQCDFMAMISPEMVRRYVLPSLEEEAGFLDHCIFHLDGPAALHHLDDILSISDIDAVQWVPGDGQKPMHEWLDVLKKVQAAGKGLQIYGVSPEQVKALSKELSPAGVAYCVGARDKPQVEELLKWLEANR